MRQIGRTLGLATILLAPAFFPSKLFATLGNSQEQTDQINPIKIPRAIDGYYTEMDKIVTHLKVTNVTFYETFHTFKYTLHNGLLVDKIQPFRGGKLKLYPHDMQAVQAAKKTLPEHLEKCLNLRNTFIEAYFSYRHTLLALQVLTECNTRYANRAYTSMREEPIEAALDGTVLRVFDTYLTEIETQAKQVTPVITIENALNYSNKDTTEGKLAAIILEKNKNDIEEHLDLIELAGFKAALKCFLFPNTTLKTYCNDLTQVQNIPKADNKMFAPALGAEYILATVAFQKSLINPEEFKTQITKTEQEFRAAAKAFVDSGVLKQKDRALMATWFIPQDILPNTSVTVEPQATPGH